MSCFDLLCERDSQESTDLAPGSLIPVGRDADDRLEVYKRAKVLLG